MNKRKEQARYLTAGRWATAPLTAAGLMHHKILVAEQDSSSIYVSEASHGNSGL